MHPPDPEEPRDVSLFELWMGLTPEEWDALSESRDDGPIRKDDDPSAAR